MAYLLTLEPANEADLQLLLALAQRLGIKATVKQVADKLSEAEQHKLLDQLFGAWKDEVSGEEMVREIYAARTNNARRDAEIKALFSNPPAEPPA
jgi:hypothetical protein